MHPRMMLPEFPLRDSGKLGWPTAHKTLAKKDRTPKHAVLVQGKGSQ